MGENVDLLNLPEMSTNYEELFEALVSNDVNKIEELVNKWSGNKKENNSSINIDDLISSVYNHVQLINIPLSDETKFYIENKLIGAQFYSNSFKEGNKNKENFENIEQHIKLLMDHIHLLTSDIYENDVDDEFIYILKYIAKNIFVLKQKLKFTYAVLPWEEIEFCVTSFISMHLKREESNLVYHSILNKKKILKYLEIFGKKLNDEKIDLKNVNELPNLKREDVVIKNHEFCDLYNDYRIVKDFYSLCQINKYLMLSLNIDHKERKGQIIITRSLQVISEYLKNTLSSPNLSNIFSELLLLSISGTTREYICDKSNDYLAMLDEFYELINNYCETEVFCNLQKDFEIINDLVVFIIGLNKIKALQLLLLKMKNDENLNESKILFNMFYNLDEEKLASCFDSVRDFNLDSLLLCKLRSTFKIITNYEEEQFKKIENIVYLNDFETLSDLITCFKKIPTLQRGLTFVDTVNINDYCVEKFKEMLDDVLKRITPTNTEDSVKEIAECSANILRNFSAKIKSGSSINVTDDWMTKEDLNMNKYLNNHEGFKRIIYNILFYVSLYVEDEIRLRELQKKLCNCSSNIFSEQNTNSERKNVVLSYEQLNKLLKLKVSELKNVLQKYAVDEDEIKNFVFYKNNKYVVTIVESLVLDIFTILDQLNYNFDGRNFLEDDLPLLIGRDLYNYLIKGNCRTDISLSDPTVSLLINAKKLTDLNFSKNKKLRTYKLAVFTEDLKKVKSNFDKNLNTIKIQKRMNSALIDGNLEEFKNTSKFCGNIYGRDIKLSTIVHVAAKNQNVEVLKYLCDFDIEKLNINDKNSNGQTALHIASLHGNENVVRFLVEEKQFSVDVEDINKRTPLHLAVLNGHKDVVEILIKNNCNINCVDTLRFTPELYAVRNDNLSVFELLYERSETNINDNIFGEGLLIWASEFGSSKIVDFLLKNGANVHMKSEKNSTALSPAALNGHLSVIKTLIDNGAKVNGDNLEGCTPLICAVEAGQEAAVEIILKNKANPNACFNATRSAPLHFACKSGFTGIVKKLLKHKSNPEVHDVAGFTPFLFAVGMDHLEVAETLLEHGVNINLKDVYNITALHLASRSGNKKIAELLIKRNKLLVNAKDDLNSTPLHLAIKYGHKEVIEVLIKNGANVNAATVDGLVPLHFAAIYDVNGSGVIDCLLKNNAIINRVDNDNFTPLHSAVKTGCIDNVMILIKNNANVNCKTMTGETLLHTAALFGHVDIVNLLIENNVKINVKDKNKNTPLHFAVEAGNTEIVKILLDHGALINEKNKCKQTPLILAVNLNREEIVDTLVVNGADIIYNGHEALIRAIFGGFKDIVKILLKNYENVLYRDRFGYTFLHIAAAHGRYDIIEILLKKGADINAITISQTDTPLTIAVRRGHEKVVKVLLMNGADIDLRLSDGISIKYLSALEIAAKMCNLEAGASFEITNEGNVRPNEYMITNKKYRGLRIVKLFLNHKNDVNKKGADDRTLLHIACEGGNLVLTKLLLEHGADINAKTLEGKKASHIAAGGGFRNILECLIDNGSNIKDVTHNNQILLHFAALSGNQEIVQYLIKKGAEINAKDCIGTTPLYFAIRGGHLNIIKILLDNGAFYNCKNPVNLTPKEMHCIFTMGSNNDVLRNFKQTDQLFKHVKNNEHLKIASCIKNGAFVNAKSSSDSLTPLNFAIVKQFVNVVKVLLENEANPNITGENGWAPLHYASKSSRMDIVKLLLSHGAMYNVTNSTGKTPLDLATDKDIISLLKLIHQMFQYVKNQNSKIFEQLSDICDITMLKTIMCAKNEENRSIIAVAMCNDFPNIEKLKIAPVNQRCNEMHTVAQMLTVQGNFEDAYNTLNEIYKNVTLIVNEDNPVVFDLKHIMSCLLYKQHKNEDALKMLNELSKAENEQIGKYSEDSMVTRRLIGNVLCKLERSNDALDIFRDICDKQIELLGVNHEETLDSLKGMVVVLEKLKIYEEALSLSQFLVKKFQKKFGDNHNDTLDVKFYLGVTLSKLKRYNEAIKVLENTYKTRLLTLGKYSVKTVLPFHEISKILLEQKDYHYALKMYQELHEIMKNIFGAKHERVLKVQFWIGHILYKLGKSIDALKIFKEVVSVKKLLLGADHPDVKEIYSAIEAVTNDFKLRCNENIDKILEQLGKKVDDLHSAVNNNDVKRIRYLIENGIDINKKDAFGRTPLHYAIDKGFVNIVNILLKNNADMTLMTNKNNTTLHIAVNKNNIEIIDLLLNSIDKNKIIKFINVQTSGKKQTALHIAAEKGNISIIKKLLKNGAFYNIKNSDNKTPNELTSNENIKNLFQLIQDFFEKAKVGDDEVVNKLYDVNVDEYLAIIRTRDSENISLLQTAVVKKHTDFAKKFINILKETKINELSENL